MSQSFDNIPAWLLTSKSHSHLEYVFQILAQREAKRDYARSSQRLRSLFQSTKHSHIPWLSSKSSLESHYSVAVGHQRDNQLRNRYADVEPYDRTRVVVGGNEDGLRGPPVDQDQVVNGRYLNASWVLELFGNKWWIATQAPLPHTSHTFLSILLQPILCPPGFICPLSSPCPSRVRTVVQLTQNIENGRQKAHAYFPSEVGKTLLVLPDDGDTTPALMVTLVEKHFISDAHCIQSTLSVVPIASSKSRSGSEGDYSEDNYGEEGREGITFQHMLYVSWPDQGVPEPGHRASLMAFLRLVDTVNRDVSLVSSAEDREPDPNPPIMVGCSAGIGRTGSFIALSSLLRTFGFLPEASSATPSVSSLAPSPLGPLPSALREDLVAQEVDSLREQRPGMVQRNEQILLIYEMLATAF